MKEKTSKTLIINIPEVSPITMRNNGSSKRPGENMHNSLLIVTVWRLSVDIVGNIKPAGFCRRRCTLTTLLSPTLRVRLADSRVCDLARCCPFNYSWTDPSPARDLSSRPALGSQFSVNGCIQCWVAWKVKCSVTIAGSAQWLVASHAGLHEKWSVLRLAEAGAELHEKWSVQFLFAGSAQWLDALAVLSCMRS